MESQRTIWTAIIVLIVGIALIFLRSTAIDIVVMVLGAMFVAASALNLFFLFRTPTVTVSGGKVRRVSVSFGSLVAAVAAGALGIWMLFDPSSMSSLIVYAFPGLMILAGLYHVVQLAFGFRPVRFPLLFYVFPVCLIICGVVVMVLGAVKTMDYIVLVTGISMIVFSVISFLEVAGAASYRKEPDLVPADSAVHTETPVASDVVDDHLTKQ